MDPRSVYGVFDAFVAAHLNGEQPDAAAFAARLPSEGERQELLELVKTVTRLDSAAPETVGPGHLFASRYRFLRPLGRGGMGRVWLVHDESIDRQVALKLLECEYPVADAAQLMRRERKALARLRHPNIVTFHDADVWDGKPYLVMDPVVGKDLESVLRTLREERSERGDQGVPSVPDLRRAIGEPQPVGARDVLGARGYFHAVASIVVELARALECAHGADVVHRDIKPGNILLTGSGSPILVDFGLASLADATRGPMTSLLVGTRNYFAPEQVRDGRAGSDPRTDIYQLGAVLYELSTVSVLRSGLPEDEIVRSILDHPSPDPRAILPAVPVELAAICRKAMCENPDRRYQTANALRVDLERFLERRLLPEAIAGGASWGLRARYALRRHARWVILVALLVASVVWLALR